MKDFIFTEGDLRIEIKGVVDAWKFDDANHGLNHCMKAVDFIVKRSDCYLYIEFKDPQAPGAKGRAQQQNFIQDFLSGRIEEIFTYKYRDSFLYEWASGRADKPVHYLVLVALDTLTTAELGKRTDALKRMLPLQRSKPIPWPCPFVQSCQVYNLATWNQFNSDLPVSRLSTI